MKKIIIVFLLLLVFMPLFAEKYEIVEYSFKVEGKTKASSLSEAVGKTGSVFETEDELRAYLDGKRQALMNRRLFLSVSYTYAFGKVLEDGNVGVSVIFEIEDADSFFWLPYPKYDSNYGFKFGVKVWDKNFLGFLSNLYAYVGFEQRDKTFKKGLLDYEFTVDSIEIGNVKASLSTSAGIDLNSWTGSYFNFRAGVSEIKIKDLSAAFSAWVTLKPAEVERDSRWNVHEIGSSASFELNTFSFGTSVGYFPNYKQLWTSSSMKQGIGWGFYDKIKFSTNQFNSDDDTHPGIDTSTLGFALGKNFTIARKLDFNVELWAYEDQNYETMTLTPYFKQTISTERSTINWEENFRRGFAYGLSLSFTEYPHTETVPHVVFSGDFRAHYPVTSWFNPSIRLGFFMSNLDTTGVDTDYLRGILIENAWASEWRKKVLIINIDLMMQFITLEDFCHTYAIPFMDIAVVSNELKDDFDYQFTVGGEGIIILDEHPGYPIRGSLGINLNDFIQYAKGELDFWDIEYEIFIGFDFLY